MAFKTRVYRSQEKLKVGGIMKKVVFLTATRAEFGKLKTLMLAVENSPSMECYIFVTGMHMMKKYGLTYYEVKKTNFSNIYAKKNQTKRNDMEKTLAKTINIFSEYVKKTKPDLIVVHGDRLEALAGSIVGAFLNIRVAHIEGGEISGTVDESIRHAITKFSHIHFVSNHEAKKRIVQLGEKEDSIKIIGSPDIDVMHSGNLPSLESVKKYYEIDFNKFGIVIFHPVVTELDLLPKQIKEFVDALIESGKKYVVIFPNNDSGTEIIQNEYKRLRKNSNFRIFPSIRLESFLVLLKECEFMIGNSSAGIRETGVYGVPSIDLGNRQKGRYTIKSAPNVCSVGIQKDKILDAIKNIHKYRKNSQSFGEGNSAEKFMAELLDGNLWETEIQKHFIDLE